MRPLIPWFETPIIPLSGDIAIHGFGVMVALGFWIGTKLASMKAGRDGLNPELPNRLVGWLIAATFIGGHLGHAFFYDWEHYKANPIELLYFWDGLSSTGGLLTATAITYVFFRFVEKKPFLPYGDTVAFGLMTGWIFGRLGCFVAHDHPGVETTFWLGVRGMCPPQGTDLSVACHDMGLYEAIWAMFGAALFHWLDRKPRHPGFFLGMLAVLYGPFRFGADFLRHPMSDERLAIGLTPAQLFALGLVGLGITLLVTTRKGTPVRLREPEHQPDAE